MEGLYEMKEFVENMGVDTFVSRLKTDKHFQKHFPFMHELEESVGKLDEILTMYLNDKKWWDRVKSDDESDDENFICTKCRRDFSKEVDGRSSFEEEEEIICIDCSNEDDFGHELCQEAKDYLEKHNSFHPDIIIPNGIEEKTHLILVAKAHYDEMMTEIMALKPNKRKNWKRKITDRYGCDSKCRYRNGKIENYQGNHRCAEYGKWLEVVNSDYLKENMKEGTAESSSLLGHLQQKIFKAEEEGRITKEQALYYRNTVMEKLQYTFHTGKHTPHNHNIMCGAGLYGVGK